MNKFYEYLLSIGENWLRIDEGIILTSEKKYDSWYTEWKGSFDTGNLKEGIKYSIKDLLEGEHE